MANPTDGDNDGRFPDGSPVLTPYPAVPGQEQGDRAAWPWLPATVARQAGPDEWELVIEAREAARMEDGTPAPDGTPEDDLCHPVVFRDSSEIRPASPQHRGPFDVDEDKALDALELQWGGDYDEFWVYGGQWGAHRKGAPDGEVVTGATPDELTAKIQDDVGRRSALAPDPKAAR
jgi:hypothetical protein